MVVSPNIHLKLVGFRVPGENPPKVTWRNEKNHQLPTLVASWFHQHDQPKKKWWFLFFNLNTSWSPEVFVFQSFCCAVPKDVCVNRKKIPGKSNQPTNQPTNQRTAPCNRSTDLGTWRFCFFVGGNTTNWATKKKKKKPYTGWLMTGSL